MLVVLLPTDFSENARNAAIFASRLFKYRRVRFLLVHAGHPGTAHPEKEHGTALSGSMEGESGPSPEARLRQECDTLAEALYNPRHSYQSRLLETGLQESLNPLVRELGADIAVMGTRGRMARDGRAFGSRTLRAFKSLDCPVLAVPDGYAFRPPRRMVFATDFRVPYQRRQLKLLCEMAGSFRSSLSLLYVSASDALDPVQQDNRRFLESALHKAHIEFAAVPGRVRAETILGTLGSVKAHLLIMVNTGHGVVDRFLEQFTLDRLGMQVDIPFLVMQHRERPGR